MRIQTLIGDFESLKMKELESILRLFLWNIDYCKFIKNNC